MYILVWFVYKVKLSASVEKRVTCESCGCDFSYVGTCKAVGRSETLFNVFESSARREAEIDALERWPGAVERFELPVPCPNCGHYQRSMIQNMKRNRLLWMNLVGYGLAVPALLAGAFLYVFATKPIPSDEPYKTRVAIILPICLSIVLACLAFPLWRFFANRRFNPNRTPLEERLSLGRGLAVLLTVHSPTASFTTFSTAGLSGPILDSENSRE